MGLAGTVTVSISPVAASAMPAFWPTPLAEANSVTWRKGLRLRRASRCTSRGRTAAAASDAGRSKAGPVARRRPLTFWVVKDLPLWIACEVSCRIRIRECKRPGPPYKQPGTKEVLERSFIGVLAAGGLHPEAVFQQPVVVPPPLPVMTRTPDPLAELGSGSGNALVSALVLNYKRLIGTVIISLYLCRSTHWPGPERRSADRNKHMGGNFRRQFQGALDVRHPH
jgi:hypothetical protein